MNPTTATSIVEVLTICRAASVPAAADLAEVSWAATWASSAPTPTAMQGEKAHRDAVKPEWHRYRHRTCICVYTQIYICM